MERKMTRRESRNTAFILVFESLFRADSPEELLDIVREMEEIPCGTDAENMFFGVIGHFKELDEIIGRYSEKRHLERIPKVNVAILRLALFEILYDSKVPMRVAINEAVLLAKSYAMEADVAFVNGVLGAFSRSGEAPPDTDDGEPEGKRSAKAEEDVLQ